MEDGGMTSNHKTIFRRVSIVLWSLFLSACALSPASEPKKVQTHGELFLKLKEGFYSGKLMEEEFFAKELGYPLKELPRYEFWEVSRGEHKQTIEFDKGQLNGVLMHVASEAVKPNIHIFRMFFKPNKDYCYSRAQFEDLWKAYPSNREWSVSTPHVQTTGNTPVTRYMAWTLSKKIQNRIQHISFQFNLDNFCLLQVLTSSRQPKE
jgi:hypothetical protein